MRCENKNYLLDLYFNEGNEHELNDARIHIENCESCRSYLADIKNVSFKLDQLGEETPDGKVFGNILTDISTSVPKPIKQKNKESLVPILQIAFGQIFLYAIIYFLNLKLKLLPEWKTISEYWLVQSIGSVGLAVILVLCAGTFLTLSFAPILLFESKERKSFS